MDILQYTHTLKDDTIKSNHTTNERTKRTITTTQPCHPYHSSLDGDPKPMPTTKPIETPLRPGDAGKNDREEKGTAIPRLRTTKQSTIPLGTTTTTTTTKPTTTRKVQGIIIIIDSIEIEAAAVRTKTTTKQARTFPRRRQTRTIRIPVNPIENTATASRRNVPRVVWPFRDSSRTESFSRTTAWAIQTTTTPTATICSKPPGYCWIRRWFLRNPMQCCFRRLVVATTAPRPRLFRAIWRGSGIRCGRASGTGRKHNPGDRRR